MENTCYSIKHHIIVEEKRILIQYFMTLLYYLWCEIVLNCIEYLCNEEKLLVSVNYVKERTLQINVMMIKSMITVI